MDPWIFAFERMSARHWQATEQAGLGGWLLRASGGFTGRANSALPLGNPGMPTERAVDEVEAWYRRRGLKPMIVIATGLRVAGNALDDLLARRGWPVRRGRAVVMTARAEVVAAGRRAAQPSDPAQLPDTAQLSGTAKTPDTARLPETAKLPDTAKTPALGGPSAPAQPHSAKRSAPAQPGFAAAPAEPAASAAATEAAEPDFATAPAEPAEPAEPDFAAAPDGDWLAACRYRGQRLPRHALPVLLSAPVQMFASVRRDGRTVATGRLSVADGWGGITAIEVDPACRRAGLATAVTAGLAAQAAALGAARVFIQVEEQNTAARALYARCGFADRHRYHYRMAPG